MAQDGSQTRQELRDSVSATPGSTREWLSAEQDALAGLGVRAHQIFAGSQYVFGSASATVRTAEVMAEEIDEALETFVPAEDHGDLLARLDAHPYVAFLRGPDGGGKYAVARRALVDGGFRRLVRLDPEADLRRFDGVAAGRDAGFILENLPQSAADRLTLFDLTSLETTLRASGGRLIITLSSRVRVAEPELQRRFTEMTARADATEVAVRHTYWCGGPGRAQRCRDRLAASEVRSAFDLLTATTPLTLAAAAGREIAEFDGPEDQLGPRLVRSLRQTVPGDREDVTGWLESMPDLATQCLAVSTAVFGGEAYETVAFLSERLRSLLQPEETAENPDRPRNSPFTSSASTRLRGIRAVVTESTVATRHGDTRGRVVRFTDPDTALRVLHAVWTEYDPLREVLPRWLRECAYHQLPTVGVRAAVAAGVLARQAFETVRSQILTPWAGDERPRVRNAAATALYAAAESPQHRQAVGALILAWSNDRDDRSRAVAVRAWRFVFSEQGTQEARALLHGSALSEKGVVIEAVCASMAEYLTLDDGRHVGEALDLLDRWIRSGGYEPHCRFTGELAFLYAANDLWCPPPGAPADSPRSWPVLLRAAATDPIRQRDVALLWEAVINSADVYEVAHTCLAEWARKVDGDERGRRALARLLTAAASGPRSERIVRHLARSWAADSTGQGAPLTAAEIIRFLDMRSTAS